LAGGWRSQRVGAVPFAFSPAKGTVRSSLFAYDGDNLTEEANSSGTEVASYSQGLNIDEPLAMDRSSVASFYEADGLGSVTSLSSSAGALAETYTRDSFGKQTGSTGSITNPFQYTARESDVETGLYYYRARYFDPNAGKFLSEDPVGFLGGGNFYAYVGNSAPNFDDPLGLAECVYSISQHTMTCTSSYNPKVGPKRVLQLGPQGLHSGDPGPCQDKPKCTNVKNHGPVQPGRYILNPDERPEHRGWGMYRLQPTQWSKWDSFLYFLAAFGIGNKRGGFEFHLGSITHGCINADKFDPRAVEQYNAIRRMLEAENGSNYLTVVP